MNKIFLAFANTESDLRYLEIEEREIEKALTKDTDCIIRTNASIDTITTIFSKHKDITVFHFGGHADEEEIALAANGYSQKAYFEGFAPYLAQQNNLQLVFLNGCNTRQQAEYLIELGIPYVIGTSMQIGDKTAMLLATKFYQALANKQDIEAAYEKAKQLTLSEQKREHIMRGLRLRSDDVQEDDLPWQLFKNPKAQKWCIHHPPKQLQAYYDAINIPYIEKYKYSSVDTIQDYWIYKDCLKNRSDEDLFNENLNDFIKNDFLQNKINTPNIKCPNSRFLILLGQPGQGKTTFSHRLFYDLSQPNTLDRKVYLVKFRELEDIEDLLRNPFAYLTIYFKEEYNLQFDTEKAVLILDGLDELFVNNGLKDSDLKQLIRKLTTKIDRLKNTYCILTSRYNYIDLPTLDYRKTVVLKMAELDLEKQLLWLQKFRQHDADCTLTAADLKRINDKNNENFEALRALIRLPIFLYILANNRIAIDEKDNKVNIYNKLFDTTIQRIQEKEELRKYQYDIAANHFKTYLAAIAFAIHENQSEHLTREELLVLEATETFKEEVLEADYDNINDALKDIVASFYFKKKQGEAKKNYTLEFFHKSIREFLTAQYIWDTTLLFFKKDHLTWQLVLEHFWNLFSIKRLTDEIRDDLIQIIQNHTNIAERKALAAEMKKYLPDLCKIQFLWKYDATKATQPPMLQACTCFYGYWTILSYLLFDVEDIRDEDKNFIEEGYKQDFARLLRLTSVNDYTFYNLSYQWLVGVNLVGWHVYNSLLIKADLHSTNLSSADLSSADLHSADLHSADLSSADLSSADLSSADLHSADLRSADLHSTNLHSADLRYADLRFADLRYADLRYADLRFVNLRFVNLRSVNLRSAEFGFARVNNKTWLKTLKIGDYPPKGIEEIINKYTISEEPDKYGYYSIIKKEK